MIKVFVDSGSSIKLHEKEKYDVEILPLKILLNGKEYLDGVDLSMDVFYDELINNKQFPKTSLPSLEIVEREVLKSVDNGDDVIILTISSGISGTFNALSMLFEDQPKVKVVDSNTTDLEDMQKALELLHGSVSETGVLLHYTSQLDVEINEGELKEAYKGIFE